MTTRAGEGQGRWGAAHPNPGEPPGHSAIELVGFFDALVEERLDPESVLRAAAKAAGCRVGLTDGGSGGMRALPDGTLTHGPPPADAAVRPLTSGHRAWLARRGDPRPLDGLLLERLAIACAAALGRADASAVLGAPALLELAISGTAPLPDRARALRLLGTRPGSALTLVAVTGTEDPGPLLRELAPTTAWTRGAALGGLHAVAVAGPVERGVPAPAGVRIGVGGTLPAIEAPRSWEGAVHALRFAGTARSDAGLPPRAREPAIYQDRLGAFELLARRLTPADITDVPDIDVLDRLAADPAGAEVLTALEVVVTTGSLREAARDLHLHHSSVAARVARAEAMLGYGLGRPQGHLRLALALSLRRLRDNPGTGGGPRHPADRTV